jgi:hypothetical protein
MRENKVYPFTMKTISILITGRTVSGKKYDNKNKFKL